MRARNCENAIANTESSRLGWLSTSPRLVWENSNSKKIDKQYITGTQPCKVKIFNSKKIKSM
jgi:hypothetical protein